jgi:arabinose-5-phosphate isomerase
MGGRVSLRLERARRVLGIEANALEDMRARLGDGFTQAIEILLACRGKVVVAGIGKAGLVGRKLAATFASTGTTAVFLHAAEASHGDAGTVARGDVLLALSYSGETEVLGLLPVVRRFGVPVVAITGNADSSLARGADVVLDVSVGDEGCPLGLAPMASTTAMMALGDAIAAVLLEERGFTSADFALLHPGGALGRRLVRVEDLMRRGDAVPIVGVEAPLPDVLAEMTAKRLGMTVVLDATGDVAGIVTDGDLRRALGRTSDVRALTARDLMTRTPKTIAPSALGAQAWAVMEQHQITSLLVLAEGGRTPAGVVHLHDILRAGVV